MKRKTKKLRGFLLSLMSKNISFDLYNNLEFILLAYLASFKLLIDLSDKNKNTFSFSFPLCDPLRSAVQCEEEE